MRINEVEALVGITKKNIRFYEEQGLLSPGRSKENGYRDYGEAEVAALQQIKLMRKLGLPLEEIRRMQRGESTVDDGMRRHLVTLERERANTEQSILFCQRLAGRPARLEQLDAASLLEEMALLEQSGASFQNKQSGDQKSRLYRGSAAAALAISLIMAALMLTMILSYLRLPEEAPPLPILILLVCLPAVVILAILLALRMRFREIEKGEIDDAKNY